MNIFMDGTLEQELRRLAAEQGRDLDEVVETALRHYIVSETFADDGSAGVHDAPAPSGDLLDGDSVFGDATVFAAAEIPGSVPLPTDESVVDGSLGIAFLGDRPPAADSDTVIVGSADWSDDD